MSDLNFLNIDLDICSSNKSDNLVAELETSLVLMHSEFSDSLYKYSFELKGYIDGTLEDIIFNYLNIVQGLSSSSAIQWQECIYRNFDIGFELNCKSSGYQIKLNKKLIESVRGLDACIDITIYNLSHDTFTKRSV